MNQRDMIGNPILIPRDELDIIQKIAERAENLAFLYGVNYTSISALLDVLQIHTRVIPLDLRRLLNAPNHEFAHDLFGMRQHLDRMACRLLDGFCPRYARTHESVAVN